MSSRRFMLNIFIIVPRTFFHVSFRFSHKNDLMLIRSRFPHGYTYVLLVLPRGSQWLHFLISWSRKRMKDRVKINACDDHKYTSKKKRFTRWLRVKTKTKNKIRISALCQYTYFYDTWGQLIMTQWQKHLLFCKRQKLYPHRNMTFKSYSSIHNCFIPGISLRKCSATWMKGVLRVK